MTAVSLSESLVFLSVLSSHCAPLFPLLLSHLRLFPARLSNEEKRSLHVLPFLSTSSLSQFFHTQETQTNVVFPTNRPIDLPATLFCDLLFLVSSPALASTEGPRASPLSAPFFLH